MQQIRLSGTDLVVSELYYGGVSWGVRVTGAEMDQLVGLFRDIGGNFFDTAHCYSHWLPGGSSGSSERALAGYFRRSGGRDEAIVPTKSGMGSANGYRRLSGRYLSAEQIGADIDDSLGRLETEVIDLYWLHCDDPAVGVEEIIDFLNVEVSRGRILYLGASNWSAARIDAANTYAARRNLHGFVLFISLFGVPRRVNNLVANHPFPRSSTRLPHISLHVFHLSPRFDCLPEDSLFPQGVRAGAVRHRNRRSTPRCVPLWR